jgi:ABC-2 type transport system ATP-binding protein
LRESGTTIVLTTHYLEEAEELADRIGVINSGKLVLLERRDDLLNNYGERWLDVWLDRPAESGWFEGLGCTSVKLMGDSQVRFRFRDSTLDETDAQPVVAQLLERIRSNGAVALRVEGGRSRLEDIFRQVVGTDGDATGGEGA